MNGEKTAAQNSSAEAVRSLLLHIIYLLNLCQNLAGKVEIK